MIIRAQLPRATARANFKALEEAVKAAEAAVRKWMRANEGPCPLHLILKRIEAKAALREAQREQADREAIAESQIRQTKAAFNADAVLKKWRQTIQEH